MYGCSRVTVALAAICMLACSISPGIGAQELSISGRVFDRLSGDPISGADVSWNDGQARVSTDADGRFRLSNLPSVAHSLSVVRFGYEDLALEDVGPSANELEIALNPEALAVSGITVSAGTFSFGGRTPTARQTMSRADIDAVPQFAEDIFRAVNRLPGLTSGDFTSRFSIRGGGPDETLIRIDGLEIYEPYHLKDFNDGAISIIDSEIIEGVELRTGGFPARYGNYTSGVFSMNTRLPEGEGQRYGLGLSLVNARAMAEGTFGGGKGSFLASGRRGYVDLILDLMNEGGIPSPAYYDVFGKVQYRFTPEHSLSASVLRASDRWTFDANATTGFNDTIDTRENATNRYGNAYAWITHDLLIGGSAHVRTLASVSRVTSDRSGGEYYALDSSPLYDVTAGRDFSVLGLRQDWTVDVTRSLALDVGFDARRVDADYSMLKVVTQDPDNVYPDPAQFFPVVEQASRTRGGSTLGAYLATRLRVAPPLTVELGGRHDRASYTGDGDLSPRVSMLVELPRSTNLRLGGGVFRQIQGIADVSILDPTQRYFPSERSRQWTASLEHFFGDGSALRVEAYRKDGDRLRPVYRNWKAGIDVFPETNEDRILVTPRRSRSQGIEVYHQRHFGDRLSVRGSYALAKIEESVESIEGATDPRPLTFLPTHGAPRDQRHALNLDVTVRPWRAWSLTTSYTFHTGWPGTLQHLEDVTAPGGGIEQVLAPDPIYGHQLPSYHRLDARLTKRSRFRGGDLRLFFEVSNLTNRTNVFGYDYARVPAPNGGTIVERGPEGGFVILPSLGLSWMGGP